MKHSWAPLAGASGATVLGVLTHFRVLPFLWSDTILSGGQRIPTVGFVRFFTWFFFVGAGVCLIFWVIVRRMETRKK